MGGTDGTGSPGCGGLGAASCAQLNHISGDAYLFFLGLDPALLDGFGDDFLLNLRGNFFIM